MRVQAKAGVFGLRFTAECLAQDERCLYITFQDAPEQLSKMAATFGLDLEQARVKGMLVVHHLSLGDLDLDILSARIREVLAEGLIHRVVIDSLAEMVLAAREDERFPAYARSLTGLIRASGASLLITSETTMLGPSPEPVGGTSFPFHNLILMCYIEQDSEIGRALTIVKMRNSRHVHQFDIDDHGLTVGAKLQDVTGTLGWSALRASSQSNNP